MTKILTEFVQELVRIMTEFQVSAQAKHIVLTWECGKLVVTAGGRMKRVSLIGVVFYEAMILLHNALRRCF